MIAELAFAAITGSLDLSDRTEVRARANQVAQPNQTAVPAGGTAGTTTAGTTPVKSPIAGLDLVNVPSARIDLTDRRWAFQLAYTPSIFVQNVAELNVDPAQGASAIFTNAGSALIGWHERFTTLSLREEASYGKLNTTYLAIQTTTNGTPPPIQGPVPSQTITIATSRTTLSAETHPARRLQLAASVAYFLSGGADHDSQQVLPQQRGPQATASLAYGFDAANSTVTQLSASHADFTRGPCFLQTGAPAPAVNGVTPQCQPQDDLIIGTQGFHHSFSRVSEMTIAGGASVVRTRRDRSEAYITRGFPSATAAYAYRFGYEQEHARFGLDAALAPVIDFRTGLADNRLQGVASLSFTEGHTTVSGTTGAARSFGISVDGVQAVTPSTYLSLGADTQYQMNYHVLLGGGVIYVWQHLDASAATSATTASTSTSLSSAIAFISLTLRASPMKF